MVFQPQAINAATGATATEGFQDPLAGLLGEAAYQRVMQSGMLGGGIPGNEAFSGSPDLMEEMEQNPALKLIGEIEQLQAQKQMQLQQGDQQGAAQTDA